ncbi:MAG: methionine--tRNA ligase subunit beta [Candidatus Omnitrophica bacterium]|nr:methionine--tRNA ligase subunit beta [Candidatus Omnitrophota bacterium]
MESGISLDEFKKVELRVATIKDVQEHPNADKLYVIKLDVGGIEKQVVAGIKLHYSKAELLNKQVVVVDNLAPVVLRGVESQGMILAASDAEKLAVLTIDKPIDNGSKIK